MKNKHLFFEQPFAHRGYHQQSEPENSLSAFKSAISQGYGIELDVHLTKDEQIIVFHDANLLRMTGVDANISELTVKQIKQYPFTNLSETIPTLKEVLDLINGQVSLIIELKIENEFNPLFVDKLLTLLSNYEWTNKIALQTFNPFAVKYIKEQTDQYLLGQLVSFHLENQKPHIRFLFRSLLVNKISKPDFVAIDINNLPSRKLKRMQKKGHHVIAWTINDQSSLEKAKKHADQYIFDPFPSNE